MRLCGFAERSAASRWVLQIPTPLFRVLCLRVLLTRAACVALRRTLHRASTFLINSLPKETTNRIVSYVVLCYFQTTVVFWTNNYCTRIFKQQMWCTQVAISQKTIAGITSQLLTRAISHQSCSTTCDALQSLLDALPETSGISSSKIQFRFRLNYFRCYTFEGGNNDDVSNVGSSPDVVGCKSTLLLCSDLF